ncbi:Cytochrome b-c1 complex subunit 9 [Penicillium angulare]|uniref:Cytochrome b-c1 complex subunit 9 n=1 Tax=Penicillium angulare TaxID=116970 RepID=UPI0025405B2D|nr:Cytochrome b-c1 complex subunit 9 [Penicillium angulare]KAJ5272687.1 Cytochrome b-c1 complex subunit 9 [Penicillium angulare]
MSPPTHDRIVSIVIVKSNRRFDLRLQGAFAFELSFDTASNKVWDSWNAGRQWKDIKPRYLVKDEEEDDD